MSDDPVKLPILINGVWYGQTVEITKSEFNAVLSMNKLGLPGPYGYCVWLVLSLTGIYITYLGFQYGMPVSDFSVAEWCVFVVFCLIWLVMPCMFMIVVGMGAIAYSLLYMLTA